MCLEVLLPDLFSSDNRQRATLVDGPLSEFAAQWNGKIYANLEIPWVSFSCRSAELSQPAQTIYCDKSMAVTRATKNVTVRGIGQSTPKLWPGIDCTVWLDKGKLQRSQLRGMRWSRWLSHVQIRMISTSQSHSHRLHLWACATGRQRAREGATWLPSLNAMDPLGKPKGKIQPPRAYKW